MNIANKLKRKWNSRFRRQRYMREIRKKWKKKDLHRWRKKEKKLVLIMHKRCKNFGAKEPYCPRCEARDWDCCTTTDENDTYESMKCKYCGWNYSPSHS